MSVKISDLAAAGSVATTDLYEMETAGGASKKVTGAQLVTLIQAAYLTTAKHSAPADGALAAGDMVVWFDQTDGAAKLMVKAKSADGTVVVGSVSLAP